MSDPDIDQSDPADAQIADEDRSLPDSTIDALWGQGTAHDRDRWNAMRRDGQ